MKITLTLTEPTQEQWATLAQIGGAATIASTKTRLQQGRGAQGQRMPAYTKAYEAKRRAKGRQTRNRDLQFTGRMIGAFQLTHVEADEFGFRNQYGMTTARARLIGLAHQLRSKWMGWAPEDVARVTEAMQSWLDQK